MMQTDRDLKDKEEIDEIIHRGSLLTSRERQLAEAKAEVLRMSAEVERIRTEARVAKQEARELREHVIAAATRSLLPSPRTALKALAIVVMSGAILRIAYVGYNRPAAAPPPPLESLNRTSPRPSVVGRQSGSSSGSQEFKQAMSRLQDDLDSLPGAESEIVHEVNQKHSGGARPCPLEWVNGQAALSLDAADHHLPPSLTSAVTTCADAVEKLRSEKQPN